ncbi:unnamed protein product [Symbiodinium necroappetens]|uniref:Uncharacterized protein n=1 Tax=Symbiodinium necroappetens TaxID=1628268 RepID=A0A812N479_9DINO|nr:unnamed protein product [Symbiodinium necroappetens]
MPHKASSKFLSFGHLARNLEFMIIKMAQMETVMQLQQAELTAAHTEIEALKAHVGLDVQHVAMAQKKTRDPHEAGDVLKRVLDKHHRQRKTRNYDPDAHKDLVAEKRSNFPARERSNRPRDVAMLQRWDPLGIGKKVVETGGDVGETVVETGGEVAEEGVGTVRNALSGDLEDLENAWEKAEARGNAAQVKFIQGTVIDTVEKASVILGVLPGGFTFDGTCNVTAPSAALEGRTLTINFGGLHCSLQIVGNRDDLINQDFGERSVTFPDPLASYDPLQHLPRQLHLVVGAGVEGVERVFAMIRDLLEEEGCNRADTFHCMAKKVANHLFAPPRNFLPQQLKTIVDAGQESVHRVFSMMTDLLNTAHCDRGNTFDCMAQQVFHWLPQQLHTVVNAGNVFHCMAKLVAPYLTEIVPPINGLPEQLHTVFNVLAGSPVNSIKSLMAMGNDLMHCENFESGQDVTKCLGFKIVEQVPPLSFLNNLGDVIGETLNTFTKATTSLAMKALRACTSLVQKASVSAFPPVGNMPVRHQRGNLVVEMHSQEMHPSLLQFSSAEGQKQEVLRSDVSGISYEAGDDVHFTNLITQFNGREADSGSCLAFAPRSKNGAQVGNHQEATKEDWTSATKEDFVQLEPWAVPCDLPWMKENGAFIVGPHGLHAGKSHQASVTENWNKWQGYSFYTGGTPVEKCLKVTFSLKIEAVVATVVGLSFDVVPEELLELITTVCWPNQMPGSSEDIMLSVLRTEIRTAGHLLFRATTRLAKRFGHGTFFEPKNWGKGFQTHASSIYAVPWESGTAIEPMSLLDSNRSDQVEGHGEKTGSWYWRPEPEELYLASVDYGDSMEPKKTWEMRGADAMLHLSEMQDARKQDQEKAVELFNLKKTGAANFHIQGLLDGNRLELGVQMGFGPFQSPSVKVPVADIGVQVATILEAIPWMSADTKKTAIAAIRDSWPGRTELVRRQPAAQSSMVAWFKSEDANSAWKSAVGSWQGRVTKGSVTRKVEAGHGAKFPVAYLTGDTNTGIDFGQIMKPDFTICSVTRYVEGGANKRILQNNQPNWLHGHWMGRVGVTYYNTWVNHDGQHTGLTDWLVMCGNSAGVVFRGQERKNIGQDAAVKSNGDFHLFINEGELQEVSDFGVMEVIVWNRALSEHEMWTSMKYLNSKLSGSE